MGIFSLSAFSRSSAFFEAVIDQYTLKRNYNIITDYHFGGFAKYNEELSPYYAASRIWVDGIIDPIDTRKIISMGIEAANHAPIEKPFNVGVIQT